MARVIGFDERVSNKIERYKARQDGWDLLYVLPYREKDSDPYAKFFGQKIAAGQRADGSMWYATLNEEDPAQNYALEAGGRAKQVVVCLVLYVARLDQSGMNPQMVMRAMPWSFGGDKWESLKMVTGNSEAALDSRELLVRCSPNKDIKFQDLILQLCPDNMSMIRRVLADAQFKATFDREYARGCEQMAEVLRPDTRQEQMQSVLGEEMFRRAQQAQAPGNFNMGGLPMQNQFPAAGFGAAGFPGAPNPGLPAMPGFMNLPGGAPPGAPPAPVFSQRAPAAAPPAFPALPGAAPVAPPVASQAPHAAPVAPPVASQAPHAAPPSFPGLPPAAAPGAGFVPGQAPAINLPPGTVDSPESILDEMLARPPEAQKPV